MYNPPVTLKTQKGHDYGIRYVCKHSPQGYSEQT